MVYVNSERSKIEFNARAYVKDLEKSLAFYDDVFGFKVVNSFTSGEAKMSMIDIGSGVLELVQRPGSPTTPPDGNWSHMAIHDP